MKLLSLAFAVFCFPAFLHAQSIQQTWVSGVGDDANPGIRYAPCKTFSGALAKTNPGGVISVLDPGGFGAVTIQQSVTIQGDDSEGSALTTGTNGIVINAGINDVVTLRNLNCLGLKTGLSAILILQAGAVHIENCHIDGFFTAGVNLNTSNPGMQLYIKDCTIENCTAPGVLLNPTGAATVHISNSHISHCTIGVSAGGKAVALANNTVCEDNSGAGFLTTAATAKLSLVRSTSTQNAFGVEATLGAITMTECSIFNNTGQGIKAATGAKITTFSNNSVTGNTPDGAATATTALK